MLPCPAADPLPSLLVDHNSYRVSRRVRWDGSLRFGVIGWDSHRRRMSRAMLFHVSEEAGIDRFESRPSQYAAEPVVWAITLF